MIKKLKEMWAMRSGWAPWYVIIWHLLWAIPYTLGRVICVVAVLFGWGPQSAKEIWNKLT